MSQPLRKWIAYAAVVLVVVLLDIATKAWALQALELRQTTRALGGLLPLTLSFNQGAAFGLNVGDFSRPFFGVSAIAAVVFLTYVFHRAQRRQPLRLIALPLIVAGAIGNLIDRLRWDQGVVDFIGPINLGFMYWPVFNVADMAITCGAIALALSLWIEETPAERPAGASSADRRVRPGAGA